MNLNSVAGQRSALAPSGVREPGADALERQEGGEAAVVEATAHDLEGCEVGVLLLDEGRGERRELDEQVVDEGAHGRVLRVFEQHHAVQERAAQRAGFVLVRGELLDHRGGELGV